MGLLVTSIPWIIGRNVAVIPYYFLKGHGNIILKLKIDAIRGIPKMVAKRSHNNKYDIKKYIETWAGPKVENNRS